VQALARCILRAQNLVVSILQAHALALQAHTLLSSFLKAVQAFAVCIMHLMEQHKSAQRDKQ
jgi:hypothetical protein